MRPIKELTWYQGTLNVNAAGFLGDEFDIFASSRRAPAEAGEFSKRTGAQRSHIFFSQLKNDAQCRVLVASTQKFSGTYCVKILTSALAANIIDVTEDDRGQPIEAQDPYRTLVNIRAQHCIHLMESPKDNWELTANDKVPEEEAINE